MSEFIEKYKKSSLLNEIYCSEICEKVQVYLSEIFSEYEWKCFIEKSFAEITSSNVDVLLLTWTNMNDKISIIRRLKD